MPWTCKKCTVLQSNDHLTECTTCDEPRVEWVCLCCSMSNHYAMSSCEMCDNPEGTQPSSEVQLPPAPKAVEVAVPVHLPTCTCELCRLSVNLDNPTQQPFAICDWGNEGNIIAAGSTGAIFRAQWYGQLAAAKTHHAILQPDTYELTDEMYNHVVTELEQEALHLARIRHSNCVQLLGIIKQPSQRKLFVVMEYIRGGTLEEEIKYRQEKNIPFDFYRLISVCEGILNALQIIHYHQLFHRDLKPANILCLQKLKGHIKVTDFGLVRSMNEALGFDGGGTPLYMAPEVSKQEYTCKSDIWSFGKILVEMITRQDPVLGSDASQLQEALKICPAFTPLLEGCLAIDPKQRLDALEAGRVIRAIKVANKASLQQLASPSSSSLSSSSSSSSSSLTQSFSAASLTDSDAEIKISSPKNEEKLPEIKIPFSRAKLGVLIGLKGMNHKYISLKMGVNIMVDALPEPPVVTLQAKPGTVEESLQFAAAELQAIEKDAPGNLLLKLNEKRKWPIFVLVDGSNILNGVKSGKDATGATRVRADALSDLIEMGRKVSRKFIGLSYVGDDEPASFKIWERAGYRTIIQKRVPNSVNGKTQQGKPQKKTHEQHMDNVLSGEAMKHILTADQNHVLVFLTGDGNNNDGLVSFPEVAEAAINHGWEVEVWSWQNCLSSAYITLRNKVKHDKFRIYFLDQYFDDITFEDEKKNYHKKPPSPSPQKGFSPSVRGSPRGSYRGRHGPRPHMHHFHALPPSASPVDPPPPPYPVGNSNFIRMAPKFSPRQHNSRGEFSGGRRGH